MTLEHGWVCWVPGVGKDKNTLAGEVMTSMLEPKDPCPRQSTIPSTKISGSST